MTVNPHGACQLLIHEPLCMRVGVIFFADVVLCASLGCSTGQAETPGPLELNPEDVGIPRGRAEKVLGSAHDRNERLERMEQRLVDEHER